MATLILAQNRQANFLLITLIGAISAIGDERLTKAQALDGVTYSVSYDGDQVTLAAICEEQVAYDLEVFGSIWSAIYDGAVSGVSTEDLPCFDEEATVNIGDGMVERSISFNIPAEDQGQRSTSCNMSLAYA